MSRVIKSTSLDARVLPINPSIFGPVFPPGMEEGLHMPESAVSASGSGGRGVACEPDWEEKEFMRRAREAAAKIELEAFAKGYEEGRKRGVEEVARETRSMLETARDILRLVENEKGRVVERAESEIVKLTLEVARKVVKEEIRQDPSVVIRVARDAISRVSGGQIKIRVSPLELEKVRVHREEFMALVDGVKGMEIIEDPRVEPGGCIVETGMGCVDARIDQQICEIGKVLEDGLTSNGL